MQPGPIYFLTPRKCAVFGVCNEGEGSQLFYLIDKSTVATKGSNDVISYLHHYLFSHATSEHLDLHVDTCSKVHLFKYTHLQLYNIIFPTCSLHPYKSSFELVYMHMYSRPVKLILSLVTVNFEFSSGQNKNNAMVHYLMWRVAKGLNTTIELNFMIAGHTKFAPDRHFGSFKSLFRKTCVISPANS